MTVGHPLYAGFPVYPFQPPPDLAARQPVAPVAIVGGGPVGLTLACGLARHGVPSIVLEARHSVSVGSRAICISRRSLEIWARFGLAERPLAKGLPWIGGRSFWRRHEVLHFEMPHEATAQHPPMINLQQCHAEQYLVDAALASGLVDLRWHARVTGVSQHADKVTLTVDTPGGSHLLDAAYVVATDGARSTVRDAVGLELEGNSYEGRYLIADIVLDEDWPVERLAWFDPPSNPGSTLLAHRQPDNVLRVDYQLGPDEDPELEQEESRVRARIDAHLAMLGRAPAYELVWISLYRAHCLTLPRYREGRVLFAGDAAHLVPIFGVRGLNSGIDDAANLAWKLAAVIRRQGAEALLDSYSEERVYAARENIRLARKSTLFMSPPTAGHALMRDAALSLAVSRASARTLVNPRQSTAITFPASSLQTADCDAWPPAPVPGATLPNPRIALRTVDGGLRDAHLLDLQGLRPVLLLRHDNPLAGSAEERDLQLIRVAAARHGARAGEVAIDLYGEVAAALALDTPEVAWLVRPDGHIAARWRHFTLAQLDAALARMLGHGA